MTRRLVGLAVASLVLLAPAAAHAASVHVAPAPKSALVPATKAAYYDAEAGETNRLVVMFPKEEQDQTLRLRDSGAVIHAGAGCTSLDAHTVRCTVTYFDLQVRAKLRDGDDELHATNELYAVFDSIIADGGPGDDVLVGGFEDDEFDGGGGRDELRGGDNIDLLYDGDRPGTLGADLLDGQQGHDQVSYASRTRRVTVNLSTDAPVAGEAGEHDVVRDVDDVIGGRGPDRLVGNGNDNRLEGRRGADVLIADDARHDSPFHYGATLEGGPGRDRLKGSNRSDWLSPGSGLDSLSCGLGYDTVEGVAAREVIGRCENLYFLEDFPDHTRTLMSFPPHPVELLPRTVEFYVPCGDEILSEGQACARTITIRKAFGRRVLIGRAHLGRREHESGRVVVRLTRAGRRLANRRGGVMATMSLRGRGFLPIDWTTRLEP